jgi:L-asparagine transporter-like permease
VNSRGIPTNALLISTLGILVATVLSVAAPTSAYIRMVAISSFGSLFTWMMIFVTHYYFRRERRRGHYPPLRFRVYGFPALTLLGAGLMAAVLLTTLFTGPFRLTLIFGLPFLAGLTVIYYVCHRQGKPSPQPV